MVVNRDANTVEFYQSGTRSSTHNLGRRAMCSMNNALTVGQVPLFLMGNSACNGTTAIKQIQLYVGRNLPATLFGAGSPALVAQIATGTPLSASDWS